MWCQLISGLAAAYSQKSMQVSTASALPLVPAPHCACNIPPLLLASSPCIPLALQGVGRNAYLFTMELCVWQTAFMFCITPIATGAPSQAPLYMHVACEQVLGCNALGNTAGIAPVRVMYPSPLCVSCIHRPCVVSCILPSCILPSCILPSCIPSPSMLLQPSLPIPRVPLCSPLQRQPRCRCCSCSCYCCGYGSC